MDFSSIQIPLYNQKIIFGINSRSKLEEYLLDYNDVLDADERHFLKGQTIHIKEYRDQKQTILIWINANIDATELERTFVHELIHAAMMTLSWRGILIVDESEESLAYVYEEIYSQLKPKLDSFKNKNHARKRRSKTKGHL